MDENLLQNIKDNERLTDREIAERVAEKTGKEYHPVYIWQVRKGHYPMAAAMRYRLLDTFGEKNLA